MKTKFTVLTLLLALAGAGSALGATLYAAPADVGAADCLAPGSACDIAQALATADPGDTIILIAGTYAGAGNGEILITKDFITIQGPNAGTHGNDGGRVAEAEFTGAGFEYIWGIQANNVTIDGIEIDTAGSTDTWAGIRIMEGGYDRWTIKNNLIHHIDDTKAAPAAGVSNFSFGIYGDAQTTSGTLSMTGGTITRNRIHSLGMGTHLTGANVSSGVGIYLEGIAGEDADCNTIDVFTCGVWIYENEFEDFFTGQNQTLQGVTTPGGKEYSYGVYLNQDGENATPNNGAWVGGNASLPATGNTYLDESGLGGAGDRKLEVGARMNIGGSTFNDTYESFEDPPLGPTAADPRQVVVFVVNEGRKATVNELLLAPFYKSLFPRVLGEGSDLYTHLAADVKDLSDATATIVEVNIAGTDDLDLIVRSGAESASYKVSLDNGGDFNLRFGARLLFDGPLKTTAPAVTGVNSVKLFGTTGDDLLTVDFNNGNPIPKAVDPGLIFNPDSAAVNGGFDGIALRGDEQLDYQTIVMSAADAGKIYFEPTATAGKNARQSWTVDVASVIDFDNLEPIDDVLIVNTEYSVVAQDDVDHEINVINGPFRYGFDTFQINSGTAKTFEEINFANKKNIHIYGADDGAPAGDGSDVFTVFTEDGDAPDLILTLNMYGGDDFGGAPDPDDASDDYFVVRPSKDYDIVVNGGDDDTDDWLFLDCANTHASCDPSALGTAGFPADGAIAAGVITGFQSVAWSNVEETAADIGANDLDIKKELVGFAANGAHPGDDLEYKVTVTNVGPGAVDMAATPVWVTDVTDHRLTLIEQSVVVTQGSVDFAGNRSMLWRTNTGTLAVGETMELTYTVIVNTLITTQDVPNWASILNEDADMPQWVTGDVAQEHYAKVDLELEEVFGWPLKAAINSSLFFETEAGPRYMVGLNGGAKDPTMFGMGAVLCRVPDRNQAVGWDGGLGNLWYSCGEGLPSNGGIPEPLIVTDLYLDSADRIWLTTWGHSGLFYSDDGGQTWTDAMVDLSGGMGGAPDGNPDGFAQIYAITEDILGTLFISANNGDVYRSFDRGATWQRAKQLPLGSATTAFTLEADPTLPGTLYAGTFGDSLYVTSDFAETWARPDGDGLGNGYIFDIEIDPLSGNLFVGTAQGIYYSPNGGDDWTGLNSAFPIPAVPPEIRNIAFDSNGAFFASTWGQGVWYAPDWQATSLSNYALKTSNIFNMAISNNTVNVFTDTGEMFTFEYNFNSTSVDTEEAGTELPSAFALDQNYPNPFNPVTTIQFALPQASDVNLSVYDVLGRRVATLVNGQLQAGQHAVNFQASDLPSGMYLYRLTTPAGSISQKMVLLK